MESAVSFAPLRPADFVNFAGRGGAACFSAGRGGASIPGLRARQKRSPLRGSAWWSPRALRMSALPNLRFEVAP